MDFRPVVIKIPVLFPLLVFPFLGHVVVGMDLLWVLQIKDEQILVVEIHLISQHQNLKQDLVPEIMEFFGHLLRPLVHLKE